MILSAILISSGNNKPAEIHFSMVSGGIDKPLA